MTHLYDSVSFEWFEFNIKNAYKLSKPVTSHYHYYPATLILWTLQDSDSGRDPIRAQTVTKIELEEFLKRKHAGEAVVADAMNKFGRVLWYARRQGSFLAHIPSLSTGSIQLQFDGARILATMALADVKHLTDSTTGTEEHNTYVWNNSLSFVMMNDGHDHGI